MHTKKLSSWIKAGLIALILFFSSLCYQPVQTNTEPDHTEIASGSSWFFDLKPNTQDKIVVAGGSGWGFDLVGPQPTPAQK